MSGGGSRRRSFNSATPLSNSESAPSTPGLVTQSHKVSRYLFLRNQHPARRLNVANPQLIRLLTSRDLAILTALDQYRYLDRQQLEYLFFTNSRISQRRLKKLTDCSLLLDWHVRVQPGYYPRPSIYVLASPGARLLAQVREADAQPYIRRAEHARTHSFHLLHDLEANAFFVGLAHASRALPDQGLYHWVGERGAWHAYAQAHEIGPIPDGWGRYLLPEGEVIFFLEWDRGTLQLARLRMKVTHYRNYFRARDRAPATHILYVVPTAAREAQLRSEVSRSLVGIRSGCCRFWTTTVGRLHQEGPLGRIWQTAPNGHALTRLDEMALQPRSARPVTACIGKPAWWEQRPGGGEGA